MNDPFKKYIDAGLVKPVQKVIIPVRKNGLPIDKGLMLIVGSPNYNKILEACGGNLPDFIEE